MALNNKNKIISDFITQATNLCNDFNDFHNQFSKKINDLREKSINILELLSLNNETASKNNNNNEEDIVQDEDNIVNIINNNNNQENIVNISNDLVSVINYVNNINNLSHKLTNINVSTNETTKCRDKNEEQVKQKIEEMMEMDNSLINETFNSFELDSDIFVSTVSTSNDCNSKDSELFFKYCQKFNLKNCKVVLDRRLSLENQQDNNIKNNNDEELDRESKSIAKLCDINKLIENIKNNKDNKKSKLKKNKDKEASKKKIVNKKNEEERLNDEKEEGDDDEEEEEEEDEDEISAIGDASIGDFEMDIPETKIDKTTESVDFEDEIVRANIEYMMKENGFVENDTLVENNNETLMDSIDDDSHKKTPTKKTTPNTTKSDKISTKSPLLSPLRLNLLKSPTPLDDNENANSLDTNNEVTNVPITIQEIIDETEKTSKINADNHKSADEEENIKKTKKSIKSRLFGSDDDSKDSFISKKSDENVDDESKKVKVSSENIKLKGKMTRSKAKLTTTTTTDIISLDDTDSDFEEISKKAANSARKRKISNLKNLKDKLNDDDSESEQIKLDKKIKIENSDEENNSDENYGDDDDEDDEEEGGGTKKGKSKASLDSRRKIRKILDDSKLTHETQLAIGEEEERLKRVKEKQIELELLPIEDNINESDDDLSITHVEGAKVLYLDVDEKTKKPLIEVDRKIVRHLKKHQIQGINFMWTSCYESVEAIKKSQYSGGGGCVLAHCMGLGKTLQVIALTHTLLTHCDLTATKRVIVLTPINALLNWRQEYTHWLKNCHKRLNVYDMASDKTTKERLNSLNKWFEDGGVIIIGYTMFTNLVDGKTIKKKSDKEDIEKYLVDPGADLVICDEGHVLKNDKIKITKCVNRVRTKRRIVLTGSPLQNNLVEYHCMVSFVKPNLLGTAKEFRNRFANPIYNGQHADSTEADVKYMKKRAHCLHKTLTGCVQRMDYTVIKPFLPPKYEYVISIRLSDVQQLLYRIYLEREGYDKVAKIGKIKGVQLFSDFQNLYRIWSHPWILKMFSLQQQTNENKKQLNDFINDDDEFSSYCEEVDNLSDILDDGSDDEKKSKKSTKNTENAAKLKELDLKIKNELLDNDCDVIFENGDNSGTSVNTTTTTTARRTRSKKNETDFDKSPVTSVDETEIQKTPHAWWSTIVTDDMEFDINLSGKMILLLEVLQRCEKIGDKLLVFSHSLFSLDLIEKFLKHITFAKQGRWLPLVDYYRIDGTTEVSSRKKFISEFNEENSRVRLFLISTKAGGIGINLVGANRVIVFDSSWNPVHDLQSVFRVYRFGQKKPVFIYRFLAQGTMEEKIYQRQVTKQSLSLRVIDEHQLDRHFTSTELRELYKFEPDIISDDKPKSIPILPTDKLLADLLKSCDKWISKYHEHDSLLENKLDEGLSEQERKAAWEEYEAEKQGANIRHQQHQEFLLQQQQQHHQHQNFINQQLQQHILQQMWQESLNNLQPQDFILNNDKADIGNQRQRQPQSFIQQNYGLLSNNNNTRPNNNNQNSALRNILQENFKRNNNTNHISHDFVRDFNHSLSAQNSSTNNTTSISNDQ